MIFIDTGALISRYLIKDQFHKQSLILWNKLEKQRAKFVLSNLIINETATLLCRWAGAGFAVDKINLIYQSSLFRIVRPEAKHELAALELMLKYSDKKVGFTDAISFLIMKEFNVKSVFTFDDHFVMAGFQLVK